MKTAFATLVNNWKLVLGAVIGAIMQAAGVPQGVQDAARVLWTWLLG